MKMARCRYFGLIVILVLLSLALRAQSDSPSSGLINRSGIQYSRKNGKLYVVDPEHEGIAIVVTNGTVKSLRTGLGPVSIAVNEQTGRVYVANSGDRSIAVIDGSTDTVIAMGSTTAKPYAIAVDEVNDKVYVSNTFSDLLTLMDGKTNAISNVRAGSADAILVDARRKVYLLGYESDSVRVLDEQTGTLSKLPAGAMHLWAIVQLGSVLYVTHVQDASMEAINVETHATQTLATGAMPCALAVDADRNELYVTNYAGSSVSIVNARAGTTVATVIVGGHPQAIAADTERRLLYVADAQDNSVSIIDIQSRRVLRKIKTNGHPYALSVDSRTHRVFAATAGSTPYKELE
jgi:YVTN family beta-propeller protein